MSSYISVDPLSTSCPPYINMMDVNGESPKKISEPMPRKIAPSVRIEGDDEPFGVPPLSLDSC